MPRDTKGRKGSGNTPLAIALSYIKRGWHPIPLPYGAKSPTGNEWQNLKITETNAHEYFNSDKQNIGVQLGPKSKGLADVDLDCSEAIALARHFLPSTAAIFGRKSKPAAHYLYRVTDPERKAKIGYLDDKGEMICELRLGGGGKGAQTMFPGSMHPDGELVEWESEGETTEVACTALDRACQKIAVGTLLMRHWPLQKGRHEGALRIGGFLARAGWEREDIASFVGTIAQLVEDEEWKDRERAARDSYDAYEGGEPVAGLPKLRELFGDDVGKQIAKLLKYRDTDTGELLERMNEQYCVLPIGGKARVLAWEEERGRKVATFYSFQDFRALNDNKKLMVVSGETEKYIGHGTWWLNHVERRQYKGLVFKPDQGEIIDDRLNLWRGWAIKPDQGSWRLLLRHIYKVLANGDPKSFKYIIKWITWTLQNPEKHAEVALVFRGGRGTGRGMFGRALKSIFGQHGIHISSREHFVGRFNAHMMDCALLFADEAIQPKDKQAESLLKHMITEPTLPIEKKGIDVFEVLNALKIIIVSNEDWVIPAGIDERRFAMFNVAETYKQNKGYFTALYAEIDEGGIAAMMYDLLNMDLKEWHPRDDVPKTAALHEQQLHSLPPLDAWWLGLLESGELPGPVDIKIEDSGRRVIVSDPSLVTSNSLFEHARNSSQRMRNETDHSLGRFIRKHCGATKPKDTRIKGHRTWLLPPLKDARLAWNKRMGVTTEWRDEEGEWSKETWTHPDENW
jgi:hypothetical protein